MPFGGYQQGNQVPYGKFPGREKPLRPDDGFHTRAVRDGRAKRRKVVAIALAALVCAVIALFALRTIGDRDERLQEPVDCTDTANPGICVLLETP